MSSSMASSLVRRGLRLSSPPTLLLRHWQCPLRLPHISPSSSCLLLGAQGLAIPAHSRFAPAARFACSAAPKGEDTNLKKVLDAEMQCAEEDLKGQDESMLPKGFPFTIIDNPGDQTITLKQDFGSETVEVTVFLEPSEGEDEEDYGTENEEEADLSDISLVVSIDKGKGPILEFSCTINPGKVNIDSMALKSPDISDDQSPYEGPEFVDLDEDLQKEFYKFLERRGIKPSFAIFLRDYMVKKDEREYLTWLKNMKEFIEK